MAVRMPSGCRVIMSPTLRSPYPSLEVCHHCQWSTSCWHPISSLYTAAAAGSSRSDSEPRCPSVPAGSLSKAHCVAALRAIPVEMLLQPCEHSCAPPRMPPEGFQKDSSLSGGALRL